VENGTSYGRGVPREGQEDTPLRGVRAVYDYLDGEWKLLTMFPDNGPPNNYK